MKKTILLITAAKNAAKTTASDLGKNIFTVASGIKNFLIKLSLNLKLTIVKNFKLVLPIIILISINISIYININFKIITNSLLL